MSSSAGDLVLSACVGGLCDAVFVRARTDDGAELNAEFEVRAEVPYLALVLESAGGNGGGGHLPRNHQYVPALRLLLERLGDRNAVLLAALVASRPLTGLPEAERTALQGPVELAGVADYEQLRLTITSAQGRIGLPEGAAKEGNNRRRLHLRLEVPGYGPGDAARLAAELAAPAALWPSMLPRAAELLRSLIGEEIRTFSGNPNMVLAVHGDTALVRTGVSPEGQRVGIGESRRAWTSSARTDWSA